MATEPENTKPTLENTLTGYGVSKVANKLLKAKHLKEIPSQQVYTYIKNGLIKTVTVEGQTRVTETEAHSWAAKFVANRERRAAEDAAVHEVKAS
jgi:hypothetical protein